MASDDKREENVVISNSSCLKFMRRLMMAMTGHKKSMQELVLTVPSLKIYANIGMRIKGIQHECSKFVTLGSGSKLPIALLMLVCEPQFTELLKSLAEIQDQLGESIFAEVKLTSGSDKPGTSRLDVFCGQVDLSSQLRSNTLDEELATPVVLRLRLPHCVSGDCDQIKVGNIFNYLSQQIVSNTVRSTFDGE